MKIACRNREDFDKGVIKVKQVLRGYKGPLSTISEKAAPIKANDNQELFLSNNALERILRGNQQCFQD